jgi:hypothetical protein
MGLFEVPTVAAEVIERGHRLFERGTVFMAVMAGQAGGG